MKPKILIAADHAGYELKSQMINFLTQEEYEIEDLGTNNSSESVDYPDYAQKLCQKMLDEHDKSQFGILICGTGIGASIAANRFAYIRAALCHNQQTAKLAREHNNANILALGSRIISDDDAFIITKAFLNSNFAGDDPNDPAAIRHKRRVDKMK